MIVNTKKIKLTSPLPRRLKWGVAGCAAYTEEFFLPALQLVQRSKLISVFCHDSNKSKEVASKFGAAKHFNNFDDFLQSDIDSVYLSSADVDQYEFVIKAAYSGKNILCELPLAVTFEQAEKMINVCKENKVFLIVNQIHRFHPQVQKAKELLEKHFVGNIISISASYHSDFPASYLKSKKEQTTFGVLREFGIQMIDLLRFFGGDITEAKAYLDNLIYNSDVEDYAAALLKFRECGYGSFSVSYDCKKMNNRVEVVGQNGSLIIENFFGKKNTISKLIIDVNGETRKVFRKRLNKFVIMLRSVQKTFLKNELSLVYNQDILENLKVLEEIEKKAKEI